MNTETKPDEGATVVPATNERLGECMGRWAHIKVWVWEKGQFTDRLACSTCGIEFTAKRGD